MKEKQEFIAREWEKKRVFYSFSRVAAAAAVFVVIVSGVLFSNSTQVEAGIFDWISRLFVTVKDGGEQLSFSTPDTTLTAIEREEGHLPDSLPEEFIFENSYTSEGSILRHYTYEFMNSDNTHILAIQIIECADYQALTNTALEINKNASEKVTQNDITYYYSSNKTLNSISWIYNKQIYMIEGEFPIETMNEVLSLYQEEQL